MWADTLLALERGHMLRLMLWGGGSVLAGSLVLAWLALGKVNAVMLRHFAIQTAAWGAIDLAIALASSRSLAVRDYAGAQQLVNILWLNIGLDVGYVAIGVTLSLCAWFWGRRLVEAGQPGAGAAAVGAGVGVSVQGLALALLDVWFVVSIGPMR